MAWNWTLLLETVVVLVAGYLFAAFAYRAIEIIVDIAVLGPQFRKVFHLPERRPSQTDYRLKVTIWLLFSAFLAAIFFIGNALILAAPFLKEAYLWAMRTFGLKATQLAVSLAVILLGVGAFFFKLKHQRTYGAVEVIFAGIVAIISARQLKPGVDWAGPIATLIGAVYIVSRGLNNIKDGFAVKRKQLNQKPS